APLGAASVAVRLGSWPAWEPARHLPARSPRLPSGFRTWRETADADQDGSRAQQPLFANRVGRVRRYTADGPAAGGNDRRLAPTGGRLGAVEQRGKEPGGVAAPPDPAGREQLANEACNSVEHGQRLPARAG